MEKTVRRILSKALILLVMTLIFLPSIVVPVHAQAVFSQVSSLDLYYSDNDATCSVIDGDFLYVGTDENPAKIIKINLTSFEVMSRLTLASGEKEITDLVVSGTYLYAGLHTGPAKVVKIDLSTFTRVGVLTFASEENWLRDMALVSDYLYTILWTPPTKIVKVNLTDFTKVSTLNLGATEYYGMRLASSGGFLYASTISPSDSPTLETGRVVKIQLSDFTRVTAINLTTAEEQYPRGLVVSGDFLYVTSYSIWTSPVYPSRLIKIRLSDFTRNATLEYDTDPDVKYLDFYDLILDDSILYVGTPHTISSAPTLLKCNLADFTFVDKLLYSAVGKFQTNGNAVANGFLYSAKKTRPAQVYKINLTAWAYDSKLTLKVGDSADKVYALTSDGTYLYGGLNMAPGGIVKVRLSDFSLAFSTRFESGENDVTHLVIKDGILYAGLDTSPAKIVKVNATTLEKIETKTFSSGRSYIASLLISGDFLYGATKDWNVGYGRIFKINLETFSMTDTIESEYEEDEITDLVISGNYMYGIIDTTSSHYTTVIKVDLTTFSRVDTLVLLPEYMYPKSCSADDQGFLYVSTNSYHAIVSKIDTSTFKEVDYIVLPPTEIYAKDSIIYDGFLYVGFDYPISGTGGKITKFDLTTFKRVGVVTLNWTNSEKTVQSLCLVGGSGVYLYGGIYVSAPGKIVKIYLGEAPIPEIPPYYSPYQEEKEEEEIPPEDGIVAPPTIFTCFPPAFYLIMLLIFLLGIYLLIKREAWKISIPLIPIIIWLLLLKPCQLPCPLLAPLLNITYDFLVAIALTIVCGALLLNKMVRG